MSPQDAIDPCARCAGTGWICDHCGAPRDTNECCTLACKGCPDCTPLGACGGTGLAVSTNKET